MRVVGVWLMFADPGVPRAVRYNYNLKRPLTGVQPRPIVQNIHTVLLSQDTQAHQSHSGAIHTSTRSPFIPSPNSQTDDANVPIHQWTESAVSHSSIRLAHRMNPHPHLALCDRPCPLHPVLHATVTSSAWTRSPLRAFGLERSTRYCSFAPLDAKQGFSWACEAFL